VPAIVKNLTEAEVMKVALVENLQREDLDVMEEAEAYQRLIAEFGMTQEEVAVAVGKSRPLVANTIRLLQLPEEIKDAVSRGTITAGHGRAILALNGVRSQTEAFRAVVAKALNVRQTEQLVEQTKSPRRKAASRRVSSRDPEVRVIEERLKGALGTKVRVTAAKGRGTIEIEYYGFDDLDRLVGMIAGEEAI
jgi:ParB family chromosome partitioning protein